MTVFSLPRPARLAIGAWWLLAIVVFNVRFDWQTRMANHAFVRSQLARQAQGLPVLTINDGFRPMVRAAARDAAVWLVLIAAAGSVATTVVSRRDLQRG
jgi:hypothetical protein